MSKSLRRVTAALEASGISYDMQEMAVETRTAQQAADAAGCHIDQIAKSIILRGAESDELFLFITAGGNQVDMQMAEVLMGQASARPDANLIRKVTGFAVGGVAPIGHVTPIKAFVDPRLLEFSSVWAAGGTPRHIFAVSPQDILKASAGIEENFTS